VGVAGVRRGGIGAGRPVAVGNGTDGADAGVRAADGCRAAARRVARRGHAPFTRNRRRGSGADPLDRDLLQVDVRKGRVVEESKTRPPAGPA
jgi:hypothetical protein